MPKKNNGTPEQFDNIETDLLTFIYEFSDKPEVLSLIDDLVTKLKKIKNRKTFYEVCKFSPELSSALENLIEVIKHQDAKARKKDEKRGKYTIEKQYATAFKEYSDMAAAEINDAERKMRELYTEAQARLSEPKLYVGTTSDIELTKKTSKDELRQIRAFLLALEAIGAFEQAPVKKGITREELEKARATKDFDDDPVEIKNSQRASKKYITKANATVRSAGEYLKETEKMQTAEQNDEKNPYIYK